MYKGLTIVSLLVIILIVFGQMLLPSVTEQYALHLLNQRVQAEKSHVEIKAQPGLKLLFGRMDTLVLQAENATPGKIRLQDVSLKGTDLKIDLRSLLVDQKLQIEDAGSLELQAVIREADLADFLQKKVEKLKDVQVHVTPEVIRLQGNLPVFGRTAEVMVEGIVRIQEGGLYFHMQKVNIRNTMLGKALTGNLFEDIPLLDLRTSPFQLEAAEVVQKNGEVVITLRR